MKTRFKNSVVKKLIPFIILLMGSVFQANAQTISAGNDTALCPGQSVTLNASLTYQWPGSPPAPTNIPNIQSCDDCYSSTPIPLGFTFNFYGNNYTTCHVASNSYITFSGSNSGYSPWSIGVNAPNGGAPNNYIGCPWWDSNPAMSGADQIRYKTIGTAPNRIFIVEFLNLPSFSCGTSTCFGAQIHLYETTNVIETHIFRYQSCTSWNNGRGTHGIENATGTIAHVIAGRNGLNAPWYVNVAPFVAPPNSAGPEGRRWTPTSAINYNMAQIPFSPIYMPNTPPAAASIQWYEAGNPTLLGTGTTFNASPVVPTYYVVSIPYASCATTVTYTDTVFVDMGLLPLTINNDTAICIGDTMTLSANTTIPGTINYSWSPAVNMASSTSNTTAIWPTTTTTYTVTASSPGGCSNTATVTVTVNPLPNPSITPVDPTICQGESVDLTAAGASTYNWSPGTGLSATTGSVVTATPTTSTTYTVLATDVNGCTATTSNTVFFFNNPTISVVASDPSICAGFSTNLTASGALNYTWSPPVGLNFTNIADPVATLNTTQTYTIIGEDVNGCFDTTTYTVTVDPNPVVDFSAVDPDGCVPHTVEFINNSNISSGSITNYFWTFENNGGSSTINPTIVLTNNGDFDVTLIAVSDQGCTDTLTLVDYIHGYSVPTAGFFATPQPTNIEDADIIFTNTSSTDVANCFWDFGDGTTVNFCDPVHQYLLPGTYTVTLITTTQYGCSDTVVSTVEIQDISDIFIPNSFTPNADGNNDTWFPVGKLLNTDLIVIDVEVFNRWGTSVFKSNSSDKPWDGKVAGSGVICPQGTYVYKVYYEDPNGDELTEMGQVNLIR